MSSKVYQLGGELEDLYRHVSRHRRKRQRAKKPKTCKYSKDYSKIYKNVSEMSDELLFTFSRDSREVYKPGIYLYDYITKLNSRKHPDIYLGYLSLTPREYRDITGWNFWESSTPDNLSDILLRRDSFEKKKNKEMNKPIKLDFVNLISDGEKDGKFDKNNPNNKDVYYDESDIDFFLKSNKKYLTKSKRYFVMDKIKAKCYKCFEIGHLAFQCENKTMITCKKCFEGGHTAIGCPNLKCFRCNKSGHRAFNCQLREEDLVKCFSCNGIGHKKAFCLKKPLQLDQDYIKRKCQCYYCGDNSHLVCDFEKTCKELFFVTNQGPFYYSLLENLDKNEDDYSKIPFCCKCGDSHFEFMCYNNSFNVKDNFEKRRSELSTGKRLTKGSRKDSRSTERRDFSRRVSEEEFGLVKMAEAHKEDDYYNDEPMSYLVNNWNQKKFDEFSVKEESPCSTPNSSQQYSSNQWVK